MYIPTIEKIKKVMNTFFKNNKENLKYKKTEMSLESYPLSSKLFFFFLEMWLLYFHS